MHLFKLVGRISFYDLWIQCRHKVIYKVAYNLIYLICNTIRGINNNSEEKVHHNGNALTVADGCQCSHNSPHRESHHLHYNSFVNFQLYSPAFFKMSFTIPAV